MNLQNFKEGNADVGGDIGEISFHPLDDGLGFHQDEQEREYIEQMFRPNLRKKSFKGDSVSSMFSTPVSTAVSTAASQHSVLPWKGNNSKSGSSIRGINASANVSTNTANATAASSATTTVSIKLQLGAWALDMLILLFLLLFMLVLFSIVHFAVVAINGLQGGEKIFELPFLLGYAGHFLSAIDYKMGIGFLLLFIINYFVYYTLFERTSQGTIGKAALRIRTVDVVNESIPAITSLCIRAAVGLLSLVALAIPLYLDFHGKLSGTKVISNRRKDV
ncbi:MAG: RDD family protein [Oligoflexia bacterium]|nr:RDD family protein [Oligoflexia bacterium]